MALTPEQLIILGYLEAGIATLALGLMIVLYVFRIVKGYKATGYINWVRTFLLLTITVDFIFHGLFSLINKFTTNAITDFLYTGSGGYVSPSHWANGFIVMFGLMLAAYVNKKDSLLFFPVFFQVGAIVFYYVTGNVAIEEMSTQIFGVIALLALYEAGIRVKDNNALGFAVMYTMQFITILDFNPVLLSIISVVGYIFGIFLAAGLFRPFGKEET
jgi:hypothetical protein